MATTAFGICLVVSILVVLWMASKGYENIDIYYWTIVTVMPLVLLGYWLKTQVNSPEAAMITFCFIYLDSTVILVVGVFLMLRSIGITVYPWMKLGAYAAAFAHLFAVWLSAYNGMYFKTIRLIDSPDGTITKMTGGPLRIVHYIYLFIVFAALVAIFIAGFVRRGTFSRRSFYTYFAVACVGIGIYIIEGVTDVSYSLLPYFYTAADLMIAVNYDRIHSHDVTCLLSERHREHVRTPEPDRMPLYESGDVELSAGGCAAFDFKRRFLCCDHSAYSFCPQLKEQRVDELLPPDSNARQIFYSMIDAYEKRGDRTHKFRNGGATFICEISTFSINVKGRAIGYYFELRDFSNEQHMIDQIRIANAGLEKAVAAKTEDIRGIQYKIVGGMANMIENRDNSTGGHVKRTSDIICIIVDEIIRQGAFSIDDEFASDIVRAAPMHDLGKITIENAILNKPSKLTDEEYEIMKTHAAKSGEMVMILLDGVEESHFVNVAYHVARHHHERWDGRGYPEGLVGTMIPVEARIMAVADVYDALACKRSYKEAMHPDLVAKIILDGMGTQFDPALKPIFLGCRAKLEAYYRETDGA